MADLLSIGSSALLAYRQALDITGQNIANANTPGYVRQTAELQSRGTTGGVTISLISRNTDAIASTRLLGDTSSYSRLDSFNTMASRLDGLLSDPDAGLAQPLQDFFTALNSLAANPNSTATRQVVLGKAETLSGRFAELQGQLDSQSAEINAQLTQTVGELNSYASSIAQLNQRIALLSADGQPPNDLLDQRDQLVTEISSRVSISTVTQSDGTLNIYLGSGQALVLGAQAHALGVAGDAYNAGGMEITYNGVNLTTQLSGGTIGGLLDYRREMLDPALNQLGRLAAGLSDALNTQHALGMDAYGDAGGDFFQPLSAEGLPAASNTGGAGIDIAFDDVSQLGTDDYLLRYDGSNWALTRRYSGEVVTMTGTGTVGDPFMAEGLALTVSGGAAAGDQFLLQPTRRVSGQLDLAITDPQRLAAAAMPAGGPVLNSADNTNARALAGLASGGVLNGGQTSISAGYTSLVTRIGTQAQGAQMSRDAAAAIRDRSLADLDSSAGVNLDEEAANLVRWQQAYQAAAQVMATANDLFETLINATRR